MENNIIDWKRLREEPLKWRWKILRFSASKDKGEVIPFFDARDAEERLDEVFGCHGWQDEYYQVKDTLFCKLGILVDDRWIWKSGAGAEKGNKNDTEMKIKGEASDAFKLACTKWGVFGRGAYNKESFWIKVIPSGKSYAPADGNKDKIWNLTDFVNHALLSGVAPSKISSHVVKGGIKPKKPTNNNQNYEEVNRYKESANKEIALSFKNNYIGNNEKAWLEKINKGCKSMNDVDLVKDKLTLVVTFNKFKSNMTEETKLDIKTRIGKCSRLQVAELGAEISNYNIQI